MRERWRFLVIPCIEKPTFNKILDGFINNLE